MLASLFEVLKYKFKRKSITLLIGKGGGLRGTKIVNNSVVNKLAFPKKLTPEQGLPKLKLQTQQFY